MKITKLKEDWGPAWQEAQPIRITHGDACIIVFVTETGDLRIKTFRANWSVTSSADACLTLQG